VFELDDGLDFMSGSEIWAPSAEQISPSMIDRLLDERDLLRLDKIFSPRTRLHHRCGVGTRAGQMVINWAAYADDSSSATRGRKSTTYTTSLALPGTCSPTTTSLCEVGYRRRLPEERAASAG